jgi:hypothetical protein
LGGTVVSGCCVAAAESLGASESLGAAGLLLRLALALCQTTRLNGGGSWHTIGVNVFERSLLMPSATLATNAISPGCAKPRALRSKLNINLGRFRYDGFVVFFALVCGILILNYVDKYDSGKLSRYSHNVNLYGLKFSANTRS